MEANLVGAKQPLRWARTRPSHSSSSMLKIMRSRRMPWAQTSTSSPPNSSMAVWTMRSALSMSATSPTKGTASPPASRISCTMASTLEASIPKRPSTSKPVSATTTLAPCSPKTRQRLEPMPPAPPVMMQIRPSRCFVVCSLRPTNGGVLSESWVVMPSAYRFVRTIVANSSSYPRPARV